MRILITGAFGFIGGRLSLHLHDAGHHVVLGTRNATNPPDWLPQATVVQTLWNHSQALEEICNGVDAVVQTAGLNAQACFESPLGALEFNGLSTARLLMAAIRSGVKRFIYLSTAHVYAAPLRGTITEETCPVNLHPYATSHRTGEDIVLAAHQRREIDGVVIRLSNAFGAPAHKDVNCWTLLVNDLCHQAVSTGHMVLRSSGQERRDFIPLTDACMAVDHLLHLPRNILGKGLFNVGSGWTPTLWETACFIQRRCDAILTCQPQLTRVPPKPDEKIIDLDYRIDALRKTGFTPWADKTLELDRLLEFCHDSFS